MFRVSARTQRAAPKGPPNAAHLLLSKSEGSSGMP
jgi:hypothetical protein